jgi:hypothetical protein
MAVVYRVKLVYLAYARREDIIPSLLNSVRKAAEGGVEVEGMEAIITAHLKTLIDPLGLFWDNSVDSRRICLISRWKTFFEVEDKRKFGLHIYVPDWLNVLLRMDVKDVVGLRASASAVVAGLLSSEKEVESLKLPSPLVQEVKDWVIWINDTSTARFFTGTLKAQVQSIKS